MTPHLTPADTDSLIAESILLHVLWYRSGRGHKWRKIGQRVTRAECVNLMHGSGEFWLAEIREPSLAGTLLDGFADNE
ncbi:unnamed protein product [Gemmata massiliana]|uniref:Uncharacterized protein n=1 Tax=Gemmata massiliana TaxID=1210884 RepID=A0A6P2CZ94_9BACT|nr:hypothetical protein [Gemmata massiliana]VTR94209.1 unnamed protein product [Gemmata massiliana]